MQIFKTRINVDKYLKKLSVYNDDLSKAINEWEKYVDEADFDKVWDRFGELLCSYGQIHVGELDLGFDEAVAIAKSGIVPKSYVLKSLEKEDEVAVIEEHKKNFSENNEVLEALDEKIAELKVPESEPNKEPAKSSLDLYLEELYLDNENLIASVNKYEEYKNEQGFDKVRERFGELLCELEKGGSPALHAEDAIAIIKTGVLFAKDIVESLIQEDHSDVVKAHNTQLSNYRNDPLYAELSEVINKKMISMGIIKKKGFESFADSTKPAPKQDGLERK
jgi:hypothetical protein